MSKKLQFTADDGHRVNAVLDLPKEPSKKVIILAHGLTVDKEEDGIFTNLSGFLTDNGFAVIRFDFRGHGESDLKSVDMTIAGELKDLEAAVQKCEKLGFTNIGIVGASFGGGITALYAPENQSRVKAIALWNPVLDYDHTFLNPHLPWLKERKGHIKRDIETHGWTTVGSSNFIMGKNVFDEMKTLLPYKSLERITIPTLVIHGDKDEHVPFEDSKLYSKSLKNGVFLAIKGAEHGFHDRDKDAREANLATMNFFKKNL